MITYKNTNIKVIKGDITSCDVDAVLNAANTQLVMDKGLAEAIKLKAGKSIEEEAARIAPAQVGSAVWTSAGLMSANYIIHAVTVDEKGKSNQNILRQAIASALHCGIELGIKTLAIPALGCGEGAFPARASSRIICQEILKILKTGSQLEEIIFCLFDDETFSVFDKEVIGYIHHVKENLGPGPYVTVDVIIESDEGIILIERSNPPLGWALPGGFLDYGESLEEAATREALEETGLDISELRQFHTYSAFDRDPRFHTISTVFIAKGEGTPKAGSDAQNLKIVPYDDLTKMEYAFDHNLIIKEYVISRQQRQVQ